MDNSRKKIKVEDVKIKEEEQDYIAETDEDYDTSGNKKSSYLNLLPLSDKRSNVQMVYN